MVLVYQKLNMGFFFSELLVLEKKSINIKLFWVSAYNKVLTHESILVSDHDILCLMTIGTNVSYEDNRRKTPCIHICI